MNPLSMRERAELLADAASAERRRDFARLEEGGRGRGLGPEAYLEFLRSVQVCLREDVRLRGPIQGTQFLL